jgi:tetratricopeptide (TPR) repeat protein
MSVSEPRGLRGACAALIALLLSGSGDASGTPHAGEPAPPAARQRPRLELGEVPEPTLERIAEPIREGIEGVRRAIASAARAGESPEGLGAAYGLLGALYHAHGYPEPALAAYDNARRLDPADRRWTYAAALLYAAEGRNEEAIEAFLDALAAGEDVATLLRLADLRLASGELEEAQRRYERALTLDPGSAAAHFGLGRLATSRRQWQSAISHYERTLELQPEATSVHYPLGQAYRAAGRPAKAERHLALRGPRRVTFDDPLEEQLGDIRTLSATRVLFDLAAHGERLSDLDFLGFALNHFGDMEGAAEAIEGMLPAASETGEADPAELARLHLAVAGLFARRSVHERAGEHLRSAVSLDPGLLQAHLELAHLLARRGSYAEAVASYDRALALDPDHADTLLGRGTALAALGRDADARRDLERLLATGGADEPDAHLVLAGICERAGETAAAERHYRRALELLPPPEQEAEGEAGHGRLARAAGDLARAAAHFERAASLLADGPRRHAIEIDLGAALAGLELYDDAAGVYRRIVERTPESEPAQLGLASALLLGGRLVEAGQRLDQAVGALPQSPALRHLLARFLAAAPERRLRDGDRALELAERLFTERRDAPRAETLAMALAETGRFGEAVRLQRGLVDAARRAGAERSAARLEADLERYSRNEPCCARRDWTVLLPPREPTAAAGAP